MLNPGEGNSYTFGHHGCSPEMGLFFGDSTPLRVGWVKKGHFTLNCRVFTNFAPLRVTILRKSCTCDRLFVLRLQIFFSDPETLAF